MTAYLVFMRDKVTDPEAMKLYREKTPAARVGHDMTVIARGAPEAWEGPPTEVLLLVSFPTMAEARAWYDSPAYQEARQHRLKGAEMRVLAFEAD